MSNFRAISGKTGDTTYQIPRVDSSTHAIKTIEYQHSEIHSGSYFSCHHSAASKNDGPTINIYLKTPDTTKWPHVFCKWAASGAAYFRIREAPTVTAGTGTNGAAIINHNRNSATASTCLDNANSPVANCYGKDVTITSGGTIIWEEFAGAAKTFAGSSRTEDEFMLDQNTLCLWF